MNMEPADVKGYEYEAVFIRELGVTAPAGCLSLFPQFQSHFETLLKNEVIAVDEKRMKLKWNYSDISLAQYFYYQKYKCAFFWSMVELDFDIKKGKLKQSFYMNKRQNRGIDKDSRDYEKLKKLLKL
jgi:hypothetical protein